MRTCIIAIALITSASCWADSIRAIQLDLARQMETVGFVKSYMRRAKDAGFNTVFLYLEDRIKTPCYPYPADSNSYSVAEMREVVDEGSRLGLDIVPVVSPLGHTERFLAHQELRGFGEQCEGVGRFRPCDNPACFCLENPEARAWMERYLTEVAAIFPGKNFHFGFDESFNLGFCTRCRPLVRKHGLAKLFMKHVLWANVLSKRFGKRMWMWDDFFDFFPEEFANVPRDVMMCCWNYDHSIEAAGPRGHFGGRLRRDTVGECGRLGIECVVCVCPWPENVRTFTEYAMSRKIAGYAMTQWEMASDFHGFFLPRAIAAAELWKHPINPDGDWLKRGIRISFPSLDEHTIELLCGLAFDLEKLRYRLVTERRILGGTHETGKLHYWQAALQSLRSRRPKSGCEAIQKDSLSEDAFLEDITTSLEMIILCERTRNVARVLYMPERDRFRSAAAKSALAEIKTNWMRLCDRRRRQWVEWRPGFRPEKLEEYLAHLPKIIDELCAHPNVASDSEWILEVDLAMVDTHAAPAWTVECNTGGIWRKIASGVWKPEVDGRAHSPALFPVEIDRDPEAIRISCKGYGAGTLCHISMRNKCRRFVPKEIVSTKGEVRDAQNLLVDDLGECRIGLPDCTATVLHPERAEIESSVEMTLR